MFQNIIALKNLHSSLDWKAVEFGEIFHPEHKPLTKKHSYIMESKVKYIENGPCNIDPSHLVKVYLRETR
jgi:hypothetical protein